MNTAFIEEIKSSVKNWWVSLLLGILFIGAALLLMFYPLAGYGALVILFSVCIFVSGIFEIVFAASNRDVMSGWGWYLAAGVIDLILGAFLVMYPIVSAAALPFILAFWIMFRGFTSIGFSMDLNQIGIRGWGWYLVFGILAIICSIAILWQPGAGVFATVYIVAFAFLFMGFFRVMLAFDLRDLHKNSQALKEKIKDLKELGDF